MDLISKPKSHNNINTVGSGSFIKSQGIIISGKGYDLSFLKEKWALISLAAVFLTLLSFGGLRGYISYLDKKTGDLKRAREAIEGAETVKFFSLGKAEKIVRTVEKLSDGHIRASKFFVLLENVTLPQIYWQSATLDTAEGEADLRGKAASYSFLAKQIADFEKEKIKISVSGISLDKDGVGFSAKLKFDPGLLKIDAKKTPE